MPDQEPYRDFMDEMRKCMDFLGNACMSPPGSSEREEWIHKSRNECSPTETLLRIARGFGDDEVKPLWDELWKALDDYRDWIRNSRQVVRSEGGLIDLQSPACSKVLSVWQQLIEFWKIRTDEHYQEKYGWDIEELERANSTLSLPTVNEVPVKIIRLTPLEREFLRAIHDWENAKFWCMHGEKRHELRHRVTPVPMQLIELLVHARLGKPNSIPGEEFNLKGQLRLLKMLGFLEEYSGAAVAFASGGSSAVTNPGPLPSTVDFGGILNSMGDIQRWEFEDGTRVGLQLIYSKTEPKELTRRFLNFDRIVDKQVWTPTGIKTEPGPDGWRRTERFPIQDNQCYSLTDLGVAVVRREAEVHRETRNASPLASATERRPVQINQEQQIITLSDGRVIRAGGSETWKVFSALFQGRPKSIDLRDRFGRKGSDLAKDVREWLTKVDLQSWAKALKNQKNVGYYFDLPNPYIFPA